MPSDSRRLNGETLTSLTRRLPRTVGSVASARKKNAPSRAKVDEVKRMFVQYFLWVDLLVCSKLSINEGSERPHVRTLGMLWPLDIKPMVIVSVQTEVF